MMVDLVNQEVLSFHSKCCSEIIFAATFKSIFALHKVTAVKLQARLLGVNIHYYTAFIAHNFAA
jgi:hypothetical protein